jgi:carbonic anhydrase
MIMEKLITGVARFQQEGYAQNQELFVSLATGQQPEALFITCSDSRVDPNLITQTQPGDLFICRNAGNIVPPHTMPGGGNTATIEYAVVVLAVPHIIVCGHTDCGAMKGAMNPELLAELPHVSHWLSHCAAALAKVKARHDGDCTGHLLEMIEENVILQMKHLETHPNVAARLATESIQVHGWVYDIPRGQVWCYDGQRGEFLPIEDRYAELLRKAPRKPRRQSHTTSRRSRDPRPVASGQNGGDPAP